MTTQQNPARYAIRCTPHYYTTDIFGRYKEYFVRGAPMVSDETIIVLSNKGDADSLCEVLGRWCGDYRLDQNQYAPPEYNAVPFRGDTRTRTLLQAYRALGYGYSDDGRLLSTVELRTKIDRMIRAA